jgi:hypothetical protein
MRLGLAYEYDPYFSLSFTTPSTFNAISFRARRADLEEFEPDPAAGGLGELGMREPDPT